MSDLLKLLRENAGEIAEKLGEGYLDDLVEKGHAAVNVAVTNDEDPLTAEGAKAAHDALTISLRISTSSRGSPDWSSPGW